MKRFPALLACTLLATLAASPLLATWDDGVAAYQAGHYDEAAIAFRTFVERSPQAPEGYYMLGLSQLRGERSDEALSALAKAVELGPDDSRFYLALAQAQIQTGRHDGAVVTLTAPDPSSVPDAQRDNFNLLLAKAASGSRQSGAAFTALGKALEADPGAKHLWLARANVAGRLLVDTRDLELTREYQQVQADLAAMNQACKGYFDGA